MKERTIIIKTFPLDDVDCDCLIDAIYRVQKPLIKTIREVN